MVEIFLFIIIWKFNFKTIFIYIEKCPEKKCLYEGYVNSKCECQCPEYITGDLCQNVGSEKCN